jgi:hypothetical protein
MVGLHKELEPLRVKAIRSRKYSIPNAMSSESLFLFEIQNKPYNSEDFTEFLNNPSFELKWNIWRLSNRNMK